jgi:hypothetical protein
MPNPFISFQEQQQFMPTSQATGYGNQAALQQMGQLAAQAGQSAGGSMGGLSPAAMAQMLRKTQPKSDTDFLMGNYTAPSIGINPNATMGYNIDSQSNYGLK